MEQGITPVLRSGPEGFAGRIDAHQPIISTTLSNRAAGRRGCQAWRKQRAQKQSKDKR
jgi:hypothetical protein